MGRTWAYLKCHLVFSALIGGALGLLAAYMAVDHNPLEEYCEYEPHGSCSILWAPLARLATTWFISGFVIGLAVSVGARVTVRWFMSAVRR